MEKMGEFKHKKLKVWQTAMGLVRQVYAITGQFPTCERYGLADQLRRAIVSVPSNIAEGSCRESPLEFIHFLVIARGSLSEVDTQLTLAADLGYTTCLDSLQNDIENLSRQISKLISHLRRKQQLPEHPNLPGAPAPNLQTSKHPHQ